MKSQPKRSKKSRSKVSFSSETTQISDDDRIFRENPSVAAPRQKPQTKTLYKYTNDDSQQHGNWFPSASSRIVESATCFERERKLQDRIEFLRSSIKKGIDGMNRVLDNMQQARYRDQGKVPYSNNPQLVILSWPRKVLNGEISTDEYFDNIAHIHWSWNPLLLEN